MLGSHTSNQTKKTTDDTLVRPKKMVGYVLTTRNYDPGKQITDRLSERCQKAGFALSTTEWDVGNSLNPYRVGLWRALRRLMCNRCEPRRLAFSLVNFDDFIAQALKPCICGNKEGNAGLVINTMNHLTCDQTKGAHLVLALARAGKHLYAQDNICLSCCHPATKEMLSKKEMSDALPGANSQRYH